MILFLVVLLLGANEAEELVGSYFNKYGDIKTLYARIEETVEKRGVPVSYTGEVWLAFPDTIRLLFRSPYKQDVLILPDSLFWYIPSERKVWVMGRGEEDVPPLPVGKDVKEQLAMEGVSMELAKSRFPWRGDRVVRVLKGDVPVMELVFDKKDLLRRVRILSQGGEVVLERAFSQYKKVKGLDVPLPHLVEAKVFYPGGGASVTVVALYQDVEINVSLPKGIFSLDVPEGVKRVPFVGGE